MKVLVSAYACEPGKGSEPGVGWSWALEISRWHEVWVITRANNRGPIEKVLAERPLPNVHWVYFDLPRWASFWKKGSRGVHAYYCLWQLGAYFVARKLHREVRFDLVHHVTVVNYWLPAFLALLPVPFVWGPVGGGESAPRDFRRCFSLRGRVFELLRDLARSLGQRDPFVRLTARRARVALATTRETALRLRELGCRKVRVHSQVRLPSEVIAYLEGFAIRKTGPFRLVSIGNLLHWKGFELGLRAFARFQRWDPAAEYWIIGNGPEIRGLEKLAKRMGIAKRVTFWGAIPRQQVLEKLAECDALLHPSLHDSGGWVCAEAMAAGRPVVCLDLGGPALQVTEETGIKVPAISPEQAVRDLATAMLRLAQDPGAKVRMGEASRQRVEEHFAWTSQGERMHQIYTGIVMPVGDQAC
jgi:glycosyltransferase involved in cell wall biosynthesis